MRILHVITRLILGGAQQNTVMCCRGAVEAGHDTHLAYGPIHGPEGSMLEQARASGATLHELPALVRHLAPRRDVACYRDLRRLIRRLEPDAVHTHSSKAGILGRIAASHEHVPRILHTVHGLPWTPADGAVKTRLYIALERLAARHCHELIAITPQMADVFAQRRIAPRERFTIIPSGVDVRAFEAPGRQRYALSREVRASLGIPPHAAVVGIVARLDPLKGHHDLLDILPELDRALPGRDVRYLFIGGGTDAQRIADRIRADGLDDRVICTGLVPHADVGRLLTAVDVHALPSYQEGQSRTLCEALLCGCAVAGYDAGGIPAVIEDGVTGRLAPVGDRAALASAIADLLSDPDRAAAMVRAGQERVAERFSRDAMVSQTLALTEAGPGRPR